MKKLINKYKNNFFILFLCLFSTLFNFYYGYRGVFPIDSFFIYDAGYNVLNGSHPFKDYWTITGPLLDYLQAFFFLTFGTNWFSYVLHASLLNLFLAIFSYFVFTNLGLKKLYSFIYCLGISILAYPSIGTPFIDHHATIFSVLGIYAYILSLNNKKNLFLFLTPVFLSLAFFSKQIPSSYIIIFIAIIFLFQLIHKFNLNKIYFLSAGALFSLSIVFFVFQINSIPFNNFLTQYFFYPLSIGSNRLNNLSLGFKEVVLHFKFIHICLAPMVAIFLIKIFKRKKIQNEINDLLIIFIVIGTTFIFIYTQLLTKNQVLIYFMIPIITAFSHIYSIKYIKQDLLIYLIVILCVFSVSKYHIRFNQDKKFMELSGIDIKQSVNAGQIDNKFNNLKWITKFYPTNPQKEINNLLEVKNIMLSDKKNKMVITDYQFFYSLLNLKYSSPNKWYDYLSTPSKKNKYFSTYKNFFIDKLKKNKIEVIYIVGTNRFKYLDDLISNKECISNTYINEMVIIYNIENCKF